jgi:hypothetical protein
MQTYFSCFEKKTTMACKEMFFQEKGNFFLIQFLQKVKSFVNLSRKYGSLHVVEEKESETLLIKYFLIVSPKTTLKPGHKSGLYVYRPLCSGFLRCQ